MTRDEAIKDIEENILPLVGGKVISLRMAIDALKQPERITGRAVYQAGYADGYNSAQLERKGKWIWNWDKFDIDTANEAVCSKCKKISAMPVGYFCKWCGTDMRGKEHGTDI